ncbi:MAG: nitroreductase/quinone reductase family protein [Thermomicrobiales bacterium]
MSFPDHIQNALETDCVIDITTIGRSSGTPRRIETWFYRVGDRYYLTGSPGKRDWLANLKANPAFTFHLKKTTTADLAATATVISDGTTRREIMSPVLDIVGRPQSDLDTWVASAPLAEITFTNS